MVVDSPPFIFTVSKFYTSHRSFGVQRPIFGQFLPLFRWLVCLCFAELFVTFSYCFLVSQSHNLSVLIFELQGNPLQNFRLQGDITTTEASVEFGTITRVLGRFSSEFRRICFACAPRIKSRLFATCLTVFSGVAEPKF